MAQWDRMDVDGSPMRLFVGMPSLGRAFPAVIVIHHGPGRGQVHRGPGGEPGPAGLPGHRPRPLPPAGRVGGRRRDDPHRPSPGSGGDRRRQRRGQLRETAEGYAARRRRHHRLLHGRARRLPDGGVQAGVQGGGRLLWRQHHEGVGERPDPVRPDALHPLSDRGLLRGGGRQSLAGATWTGSQRSSTSTASPTSSIATRTRATRFSTSRIPPPTGKAPRATRGTSSSRSCSAACRRAASRASA